MEFFKTDDGLLHAGRIAGVFYLFALLVGCDWSRFYQSCSMHLLSTAGWWLTFGGKHIPRSVRDLTTNRLQTVGIVLGLLGIAVESYLFWVLGYR